MEETNKQLSKCQQIQTICIFSARKGNNIDDEKDVEEEREEDPQDTVNEKITTPLRACACVCVCLYKWEN